MVLNSATEKKKALEDKVENAEKVVNSINLSRFNTIPGGDDEPAEVYSITPSDDGVSSSDLIGGLTYIYPVTSSEPGRKPRYLQRRPRASKTVSTIMNT